jgi:hypothetical protein
LYRGVETWEDKEMNETVMEGEKEERAALLIFCSEVLKAISQKPKRLQADILFICLTIFILLCKINCCS